MSSGLPLAIRRANSSVESGNGAAETRRNREPSKRAPKNSLNQSETRRMS